MTTQSSEQDAPFAVEIHQNRHLAAGADTLDVAVVVKAAEVEALGPTTRAGPGDRAEVIIVDTSGSMGGGKLVQAQAAAAAAVGLLEDGVPFALVAGDATARMIWPQGKAAFAVASRSERKAAHKAIDRLSAGGMTGIGTWLDLARELFNSTEALSRHAILLTDGQNTSQGPEELDRAVRACQELFICDCRGVGDDWNVDELRGIAEALGGTVRMIAKPAGLVDDFKTMIATSQARDLPQVQLHVWTVGTAQLDLIEEAAPRPGGEDARLLDLTDRGRPVPSDGHARLFPIGDWAPAEVRQYHLRLRIERQGTAQRKRIGKVGVLLHDGTVAADPANAGIWVEWTGDPRRYGRIDPVVAALLGQEALRDALQEGMAAWANGDTGTATLKLGEAARQAHEHGRDDTLRLLQRVVEIHDPQTGTVSLRADATRADRMIVATESVTVPVAPRSGGDDGAGTGREGDEP